MKTRFIKITGILFVLSLMISCGPGNNNTNNTIDSMLGYLPKEELPSILNEYIDGQKNLKLKESPDSNSVIELYKEGDYRTDKVYAISHSDDSLNVSYITIIEHETYKTNYCCTEYRESNCSLSVYKFEDDSVININEALPKLVNESQPLENAFLEGKLKSRFIYPSVSTDSIVFTNENNQLQTILVWEQNRYILHDKKDIDYKSFFNYKFYVYDTLLIESLVNLYNAIEDTNFEVLNRLIKFPVEVYEESGNTTRYISDIDKLYNEFLINMARTYVLGSEIESLKSNKKYNNFSWSTNNEYKNAECEKVLTYKPASYQIYQFIFDYTFIKDCESYKLAEINY